MRQGCASRENLSRFAGRACAFVDRRLSESIPPCGFWSGTRRVRSTVNMNGKNRSIARHRVLLMLAQRKLGGRPSSEVGLYRDARLPLQPDRYKRSTSIAETPPKQLSIRETAIIPWLFHQDNARRCLGARCTRREILIAVVQTKRG